MSVRLETRPWLTKNFAVGALDTDESPGRRAAVGDASMVLNRSARPVEAASRRARRTSCARRPRSTPPGRPVSSAHAPRRRHRNTNVTTGLFRNGSLVATRRAGTHARDRRTSWSTSSTPSSASTTRRSGRRLSSPARWCRGSRPGSDHRGPPGGRSSSPPREPSRSRSGPSPADVGPDRLVNALAAARLQARRRSCRLRHGLDVRRVAADGPSWGAMPRARAGTGGARGTDREAAAGRPAGAGPGDRPGHGRRDPVRRGPRPHRAGERPDRRRRRSPRPPDAPRTSGSSDRRPLRGAVARGSRTSTRSIPTSR